MGENYAMMEAGNEMVIFASRFALADGANIRGRFFLFWLCSCHDVSPRQNQHVVIAALSGLPA